MFDVWRHQLHDCVALQRNAVRLHGRCVEQRGHRAGLELLNATPGTVPGAPQGVGATPSNAAATVAWSGPASDGGAAISGYKVYRGTSPGTGSLRATLGAVLSYADTGLA